MIRFAIFAAVSTKPQAAADKISLADQVKLCRHDGLSRGWQETAGPFIVPGHTRTRYINLRDAETAIPQLKQMLDAAQRKEFDILLLYHYNRLRSLLDPIDKTLQSYGVQLTSHTAWTEPQNPASYDPLSDIGKTIRFATGFTSEAEITEFRRRYKLGMPARILKGLHKGAVPYGYRKPPGHEYDRKAHLIPHPLHAPIVILIKDQFLAGRSLWQIADSLNRKSIPAPRRGSWTDVKVRVLLKNPFYSGTVSFGKTRIITDPRTDTAHRIPNDPDKITTAKGLHPPLWDEATQRRIEEEFKKRGKSYAGIRTQVLSHLLYCGVCGARCWVFYHGGRALDKYRRWVCSKDLAHVNRKDSELLPLFAARLQTALQHASLAETPSPKLTLSEAKGHLGEGRGGGRGDGDDIQTRLARIHEAYESGVMSLPEYTARKTELKAHLKEIQIQQHEQHTAHERRAQRLQLIGGFQGILQKIPAYLTQANPQEINAQLRAFIHRIVITPDTIHIEFIE